MTTADNKCPQCQYWSRTPRPKERFAFLHGFYEFDVDRAKGIVSDGRLPIELSVKPLAQILFWSNREDSAANLPPGVTQGMGTRIDSRHVDHVDLGVPIILGIPPAKLKKIVLSRNPSMVIDGHHRIGRAVKEGRRSISGYLLNARETRSIMTEKTPDTIRSCHDD